MDLFAEYDIRVQVKNVCSRLDRNAPPMFRDVLDTTRRHDKKVKNAGVMDKECSYRTATRVSNGN